MIALPTGYSRVYQLLMFLVRLQNRAGSSGEKKFLGLLEICQE